MKKPLILSITLLFISVVSFAQDSSNCKLTSFNIGGNQNFQVVGDDSKILIDALFAQYPETKKKGYIWKFKKIEVPGIDEPITLQVHQGLYGEYDDNDSTKCKNGHYFTTFTSEKYKEQRLSNRKPLEQDAITIYIKEGRQYGLSNRDEAEIVKSFLLEMYNAKS